jgi:hypothetical protein
MADLETTISLLARHGRVHLSQLDDGRWWCKVNMHVAAAGASFKVDSDLMPGPLSAADQCLDRIYTMLHSYGSPGAKAISHG